MPTLEEKQALMRGKREARHQRRRTHRTTRNPENDSMYVYFILAPKANKLKIGQANNTKQRMMHLQIGCPEKLFLLATVNNKDSTSESALHVKFEHLHSHGEWFDFTEELKLFVDSFNNQRAEKEYDGWYKTSGPAAYWEEKKLSLEQTI